MAVTIHRCACGKRISKDNCTSRCKACAAVHHAKILEANRESIANGKCPRCGRPVKRNLALTGWWQCEQLGAVGFRKDPNLPSCDFQTFTA